MRPGLRFTTFSLALLAAGVWSCSCSDDADRPAQAPAVQADTGAGPADVSPSDTERPTARDGGGGGDPDAGPPPAGDAGGGSPPLPPPQDAGGEDFSGYRTLPILCASVDDVVVFPDRPRVTAVVALDGRHCRTVLQVLRGANQPEQIFVKAVPHPENRPGCPAGGSEYVETYLPLDVGDYHVTIPGREGIRLRKVLRVIPPGEGEARRSPTCEGRDSFVGTCGVDLFCEGRRVCEGGRCLDDTTPRDVSGTFEVRVSQVEQGCIDPASPDQPLEDYFHLPDTITVTIEQDPGDPARATARLTGHPAMAQEDARIHGIVQGNWFLTPDEGAGRAEEEVGFLCFHVFRFDLEAAVYAGVGLDGILGIPHQDMENEGGRCERGEIRCDYTAHLSPLAPPPPPPPPPPEGDAGEAPPPP